MVKMMTTDAPKKKRRKKAYLICPVRGHDRRETEQVVKDLEAQGWDVYWPHRDTNQYDNITGGFRICKDNRKAIREADNIFMVWDGKSKGSLFDAGMAFILEKPLTVIEAPPESLGKAFQNVFYTWDEEGCANG